jgi:2-dehydropantoate 2-reductase
LQECFAGACCEAIASERIVERMWEKWVQIATAAGMTTLMRASIGTIVSSGGASFARALFDECAAIALKAGYPLSEEASRRISSVVTDANSLVTASMMKDMERLAPVEADHLIGEMIQLRDNTDTTSSAHTADHLSLLDLVMLNLRAYQRRHLAPS